MNVLAFGTEVIMCKKLMFLVSIVVLLGLAGTVSAVELKVDVGCPGQAGSGYLKPGWVEFNGTACSGAVGPVTVTNIGGSGIDVAITVGNTSDNAYRSPSGYTGDELGRDYVSADDSISQAECTMTMTLSNLPEAGYTLTSYHNCPDDDATKATMNITVSGSGVVGTPTNATGVAQTSLSQNVAFDSIGKGTVQFVADGAGEVVVTFVAREEAHKWRIYLNGFELSGASLVPQIEFESADSGDFETVSPAELTVLLRSPEEGQTYTVDYAAVGGTATAGLDYIMPGGGPACWGSATQCHGDTDNDGEVKGSDFLVLKASWYKCDPEPGYDACADFDRDGCVKGSDFLILKSNWYQAVDADCPSEGGSNTLEFAPGETSKTISIEIIDDGRDEEDETIVVELSNPTGGDVQLGGITQHSYTIIESEPSVSFDTSSSGGGESVTPTTVAVSLSHLWSEAVTVDYAVTGGTATGGGVDYILADGTLVFNPGETSKTISIIIVNDGVDEDNETIVITLSNPNNATLGSKTQHTYTIIDVGGGGPGSPKEPVRYVGSEWADTQYHDGRLRPAVGVQSYEVMHCNRTHPELADGYGWTYNHGPNIAYWKGKFYVHYLSNPVEEHREAGHTLLCHSVDGKNWSFPVVIFPEYYLDGEDYILMHQRMGFYVAEDGRLLVLGFYGIPTGGSDSPNTGNGIGRVVREVYPDDTFGPIYFIRYNRHNGFNESNTDYPLYTASSDAGFVAACQKLLSKKLITQQWWEEDRSEDGFYAVEGDGDFSCKAFCFYHRIDNVVVGLWKEGYSALTYNEGHSWTDPVRCPTLSDNSSKHWGQRTDDGRYALLYNPDDERYPLMVVTGEDGVLFNNKLVVNGEVPVRRFRGRYKDMGNQYVRGIIEGNGNPPGDDMWVTYSVNKENIWVSRVPLPVRYNVEEHVNDNFENMTAGGVVTDWHIYCPKLAPVGVVEAGGKYLQFRDTARYNYAKAVRVFPQSSGVVNIQLKVRAGQTNTEEFDIEVVEKRGLRPVRLVFNTSGKIKANNGSSSVEVASYRAGTWYTIELRVDITARKYDLYIDDDKVLTGAGFAESVGSVERIEFRTGQYRLDEDTPGHSEGNDYPNADQPVPLAVFDIDDVVTVL